MGQHRDRVGEWSDPLAVRSVPGWLVLLVAIGTLAFVLGVVALWPTPVQPEPAAPSTVVPVVTSLVGR